MKNYTSTVPPESSISKIEDLLIRNNARNITKEYEDGKPTGIIFSIVAPSSNAPVCVRLPASVDAVQSALRRKGKFYNQSAMATLRKQAERTAWRLMYDWVAVQMSLIEMRQAELLQVFMPYVWNGQQSFYGLVKESGFKALTHQPTPEPEITDE